MTSASDSWESTPRVAVVTGAARGIGAATVRGLAGAGWCVRPMSTVSYVPSAALVVRRSALHDTGGFGERLRFGEDVDLVWRLTEQGGTVRYEPRSTVRHAPGRACEAGSGNTSITAPPRRPWRGGIRGC